MTAQDFSARYMCTKWLKIDVFCTLEIWWIYTNSWCETGHLSFNGFMPDVAPISGLAFPMLKYVSYTADVMLKYEVQHRKYRVQHLHFWHEWPSLYSFRWESSLCYTAGQNRPILDIHQMSLQHQCRYASNRPILEIHQMSLQHQCCYASNRPILEIHHISPQCQCHHACNLYHVTW